jgi:sugar (pentulose or hexulose) kinase
MLVVDRSGHAMTPAVSWQAPATSRGLEAIREILGEEDFTSRTGLPFLPMFPVFRLADGDTPWAQAVARGGQVMSLGDYALRSLGAPPSTDFSLAGATGLFDVRRLCWDRDLLEAVRMTPEALPLVEPAGTIVGVLEPSRSMMAGIMGGTPLILAGGDQPAAVLGAGIVKPREALISLGTSAAVLVPVEEFPKHPETIVLPHVLPGQWVVEVFIGAFGATLDREAQRQGFASAEALAAGAGSSIPVDAPLWKFHGENDLKDLPPVQGLAPALVVEGLAFEIARAVGIVHRQIEMGPIRVAGGGARSLVLVRAIAGALSRPLIRSLAFEAALTGAAFLAMAGTGLSGSATGAVGAQEAQEILCEDTLEHGSLRWQRFLDTWEQG